MRKIVLGLIATPAAKMLLGMFTAQGTDSLGRSRVSGGYSTRECRGPLVLVFEIIIVVAGRPVGAAESTSSSLVSPTARSGGLSSS